MLFQFKKMNGLMIMFIISKKKKLKINQLDTKIIWL